LNAADRKVLHLAIAEIGRTWAQAEHNLRMTPTHYKAAIKALELSQERAGDWLGIGKRTSALDEREFGDDLRRLRAELARRLVA
jgi:hypothetical protein